jgi:hypothetical protein
MAWRVGPSGHVTGMDNDGRLGREALDVLRATAPGRFEFVHANAETAEELPGLVYARLLIFHLRRCGSRTPAAEHRQPRRHGRRTWRCEITGLHS